MAVLCVDAAEPVEVDVQDRDQVSLRIAMEQRLFDAINEQHSVGELGERVVEGAVGELTLQR